MDAFLLHHYYGGRVHEFDVTAGTVNTESAKTIYRQYQFYSQAQER